MTRNHELIKDLLVLYADDTVSDQTKKVIRDHLKSCTECKQLLRDIRKEDHLSVLPSNHHAIESEASFNSRAPFIKRFKKLILIVCLISIGLFIVFVFFSWISGEKTAEEKYEQEELAHDRELVQVDNELVSLSPSQEDIYKKTGVNIHFLERSFSPKKSKISYQYTWNNPNIDYLSEDVYWPNHLVAMDLTNNDVMDRLENTASTGSMKYEETWLLEGIQKNTEMVGLQLPNVAVFFKPHQFSISLNPQGITNIQREVKVNNVRFLIKKAKIANSRIYVYYEQLDPIKKVGLYELSFNVIDGKNDRWSIEPKINFQVKKNRVAEIPLYKQMKPPYHLHLAHAVLIIPGLHYKFSVTSSS